MTLNLSQLLSLSIDASMATLIWMVQLIIYPVFAEIPAPRFHSWHLKYMRTISYIVVPLMLLQAALNIFNLILSWSWIAGAAGASILCAWLVTFMISVPCHKALQEHGNSPDLVHRLIATNWYRTLFWTISFLLQLAHTIALILIDLPVSSNGV